MVIIWHKSKCTAIGRGDTLYEYKYPMQRFKNTETDPAKINDQKDSIHHMKNKLLITIKEMLIFKKIA